MPKYDAIISSATATPRPGTASAIHAPTPPAVTAGLELSDIVYKPASWFRLNPSNEVFRSLKTEQYLADLEADIRENGVTDNLVAMPDGLILSGESRVICSQRIDPEKRLPVRLVLSDLEPAEQEKRLILSNLLRFEIPENLRLMLYRKVGLFSEVSRPEAAEVMGKSLRQVKRDAAIIKDAEALAAEDGRAEPEAADIEAARNKRNAARKTPSTSGKKVDTIKLESALLRLEELGDNYAESARIIREAIGW